jgi:hypothetical protein
MKKQLLFNLLSFTWALTASLPVFAGELVVTRYFSGLWEQTHEESQGIVLQVVDQEDAEGDPRAVAYWFTYGDDLESAWYLAVGEVEGDRVIMDLYTSGGVNFMQPASDLEPVDVTGTLTLTFRNCNKGMAAYEITEGDNAGAGEFEISRLASLYNSRCSGGISDNTPGDAKPLMLEARLLPPADGLPGEGKAKFWERSDRSDFHVSAEDLPNGLYDVGYCDVLYEGILEIVDGEGAAQFRSPEAEGKTLLIEDPRGCRIDLLQGDTVFLTSGEAVLSEKERGPKDDDGAQVKVEVDLESTGVIEGAKGEVEYEIEGDEAEFSVQIQGVPAGDYTLLVDNVDKGTLTVTMDGAKTKLKLTDPPTADTDLLDFVPWNATIEIEDAGQVVILEVMFPDE